MEIIRDNAHYANAMVSFLSVLVSYDSDGELRLYVGEETSPVVYGFWK